MENFLPISQPDKYGAKLLGFELISVKPLPGPIGILNYIDFVYGSDYLRLKKIKERKDKIDQLIKRMKKGE
jgi:hypothetical protein